MERRAFARFTIHPDAAPVALYDVFDNGQAKTRSALFTGARFIHAIKPFKHVVMHIVLKNS